MKRCEPLIVTLITQVREVNKTIIRGALLLLLIMGAGCAQLPEYARPRVYIPEGADGVNRDGFSYRELRVEDFRSLSLPADLEGHDHHINARSCISIRPSADSTAQIAEAMYEGHKVFIGTIDHVAFEAVFVPECSWWNYDVPEEKMGYVLQHEQIHFGLAEIAARDLTVRIEQAFADYIVIDSGYELVKAELADQLSSWARNGMEASLAEHTEFDNETSLYYDPPVQQQWLEEVNQRLEELVKP